jgi:Xaa-Pro aminopeptidase
MMSAAIWSRPDLAGVALALADVVTAVATGQLTPEEGQAVAAMLEVQRRGIELADHERRLKALEALTREVER